MTVSANSLFVVKTYQFLFYVNVGICKLFENFEYFSYHKPSIEW